MTKLNKTNSTTSPKKLAFFLLAIIGILILLFCSMVQHLPAPAKGEYFYSTFLNNNFTLLAKALFFITGFLFGYFFQLNPWYTGLSLHIIFPLTSIIEGAVYKGSHNLISFEFAVQFWFALPAIVAAYIGGFIFKQIKKRKQKIEEGILN